MNTAISFVIDSIRFLSQYERVIFKEGASIEENKIVMQKALRNLQITVKTAAEKQQAIRGSQTLSEDLLRMKAASLEAIPIAERALAATSAEDFDNHKKRFISCYHTVIDSVKNFLWDSGGSTRDSLWPLVEEVM